MYFSCSFNLYKSYIFQWAVASFHLISVTNKDQIVKNTSCEDIRILVKVSFDNEGEMTKLFEMKYINI